MLNSLYTRFETTAETTASDKFISLLDSIKSNSITYDSSKFKPFNRSNTRQFQNIETSNLNTASAVTINNVTYVTGVPGKYNDKDIKSTLTINDAYTASDDMIPNFLVEDVKDNNGKVQEGIKKISYKDKNGILKIIFTKNIDAINYKIKGAENASDITKTVYINNNDYKNLSEFISYSGNNVKVGAGEAGDFVYVNNNSVYKVEGDQASRGQMPNAYFVDLTKLGKQNNNDVTQINDATSKVYINALMSECKITKVEKDKNVYYKISYPVTENGNDKHEILVRAGNIEFSNGVLKSANSFSTNVAEINVSGQDMTVIDSLPGTGMGQYNRVKLTGLSSNLADVKLRKVYLKEDGTEYSVKDLPPLDNRGDLKYYIEVKNGNNVVAKINAGTNNNTYVNTLEVNNKVYEVKFNKTGIDFAAGYNLGDLSKENVYANLTEYNDQSSYFTPSQETPLQILELEGAQGDYTFSKVTEDNQFVNGSKKGDIIARRIDGSDRQFVISQKFGALQFELPAHLGKNGVPGDLSTIYALNPEYANIQPANANASNESNVLASKFNEIKYLLPLYKDSNGALQYYKVPLIDVGQTNSNVSPDRAAKNVYGTSGDDDLKGSGNDDFFFITGYDKNKKFSFDGNDTINGDRGTDTAVFEGNINNYTIKKVTNGNDTFIYVKYGENGPVKTLKNVEKLVFNYSNEKPPIVIGKNDITHNDYQPVYKSTIIEYTSNASVYKSENLREGTTIVENDTIIVGATKSTPISPNDTDKFPVFRIDGASLAACKFSYIINKTDKNNDRVLQVTYQTMFKGKNGATEDKYVRYDIKVDDATTTNQDGFKGIQFGEQLYTFKAPQTVVQHPKFAGVLNPLGILGGDGSSEGTDFADIMFTRGDAQISGGRGNDLFFWDDSRTDSDKAVAVTRSIDGGEGRDTFELEGSFNELAKDNNNNRNFRNENGAFKYRYFIKDVTSNDKTDNKYEIYDRATKTTYNLTNVEQLLFKTGMRSINIAQKFNEIS